jgi:hypothetical protein
MKLYDAFFNSFALVLSVPQEDPSGRSLIISGADFERIKNAALINSEQRRRAYIESVKEEKERALVCNDHIFARSNLGASTFLCFSIRSVNYFSQGGGAYWTG